MDVPKVSRWTRDPDEKPKFQCLHCTSKDKPAKRHSRVVCVRCGAEYATMSDGELVLVSKPLEVSHGSYRKLARTGR